MEELHPQAGRSIPIIAEEMRSPVFVSRPRRRGFTLVELLVVIAIIGILIALLLPAIQAAREAGRRLTCANNLKHLGLGLLNYHDSHERFPPGGITKGQCCGTKSFTNWAIEILPYVDQMPLYKMYNQTKYNEDPANKTVREALLSIHCCPSDLTATDLNQPDSGPGADFDYRHGSYRGVTGWTSGSWWWDDDQGHSYEMEKRGVLHTIGTQGLGQEAFNDIRDGSSHTLMLGEGSTRTHQNRSTYWAYTYTCYNKGGGVPQSRTLMVDYDQCVALGGYGGANPCKRGWGSFHPLGLNFITCDGSGRMISSEIDIDLLCQLFTIDGGEPAELPQ